MSFTGTVATRPVQIAGGLQTWSETTDENSKVRSKMDDGQTIKARRRVTVPIRNGQASVTVKAAEVQYWRQWYEDRCLDGTLPTRLKFPPSCVEQIWRFSTPLTYEWIDNNACRISFNLEKLPFWVD